MDCDTLVEKVKNDWANDNKEKYEQIKNIDLYIKPEEYCAYYVINSKEKGRIELK